MSLKHVPPVVHAQHPKRSFTVHMVCAEEERLYDAGEPSTCVYSATLATPLACSEQQHKEVRWRRWWWWWWR